MNDFEALIVLNAARAIPPLRVKRLIAAFGQPVRALEADPHEWRSIGGLTQVMVAQLKRMKATFDVAQEQADAKRNGIKIVTFFDADYPAILKEIADPPPVLYVKGDVLPADENAVGVVGSRGASPYGLQCARDFSLKLASFGLTVVSGMARGIDTAAHRAALDAGGRTIAVLGSGLLDVYPPDNESLFLEISAKGAAISEFPLRTPPLPMNFPMRNRVISGLARGVLIVEASQRSGALITARCALEQNREVFAIPGKLTSETSSGANDLIKQGARMVTAPEEILMDLKPLLKRKLEAVGTAAVPGSQAAVSLTEEERGVMTHLTDEPKHVDEIEAVAGLGVGRLLAVLMQLEFKGVVKQVSGKQFMRV